jgi:hypothetical protein
LKILPGRRLPRITEDNIITVDVKDISEDISWMGLDQDRVQSFLHPRDVMS